MKLCTDCAHCNKGSTKNASLWLCDAPQNMDSPSMVDGGKRRKYEFCINSRDANDGCSNSAKWFTDAEWPAGRT